MVLVGFAWFCLAVHRFALFCMVLHGLDGCSFEIHGQRTWAEDFGYGGVLVSLEATVRGATSRCAEDCSGTVLGLRQRISEFAAY